MAATPEAVAVNTAKLPPKQLAKHCIQPGQALNPNGRPKGSKNKITKLFIDDVTQEWVNRGNQALQDLTSKELVHVLVAILPKDVLLAIQGDTGTNWVISAAPILSSDDWFDQAKEEK